MPSISNPTRTLTGATVVVWRGWLPHFGRLRKPGAVGGVLGGRVRHGQSSNPTTRKTGVENLREGKVVVELTTKKRKSPVVGPPLTTVAGDVHAEPGFSDRQPQILVLHLVADKSPIGAFGAKISYFRGRRRTAADMVLVNPEFDVSREVRLVYQCHAITGSYQPRDLSIEATLGA